MDIATHRPATQRFKLHDDSLRSRVMLGASFSMRPAQSGVDGLKNLLRDVPSVQQGWYVTEELMEFQLVSSAAGDSLWSIGCEESAAFPKSFRAVARSHKNNMCYHLALRDDFSVICEPADLMDSVPDSIFGALLGAAAGMTEMKRLRLAAEQAVDSLTYDLPRSDWRAPRFSFTLRTATGSPFAERWAFAIQESSERAKRFRIWIEQQRTGKEIQLMQRDDGTVEGLHDVEALPAAIHGAGLGMLCGMGYVLKSPMQAQEKPCAAENGISDAQYLTDDQAEKLLERYVSQLRQRRKAVPDN